MRDIEGFFDESAAGLDQNVFCLGGYLIDSQIVPKMTDKWQSVLKKYGVPIFHMKDCAHGNGNFKNINKSVRSNLVSSLIDIIHNDTIAGLTVTVNIHRYNQDFQNDKGELDVNYYQKTLQLILLNCARILEEEKVNGRVSFNFEAGFKLQGSASAVFDDFTKNSDFIAKTVNGYAFLSKKDGPALLQAADLLVWMTTKNFKNMSDGRKTRADSMHLRSTKHYEQTIYRNNGIDMILDCSPNYQGVKNQYQYDRALIDLHNMKKPRLQTPDGTYFIDGQMFRVNSVLKGE